MDVIRKYVKKTGVNIIDRITVTDLLKYNGRVIGAIGITEDTVGIHNIDVNGLSGSFIFNDLVIETPIKLEINWWVIGGIISAVIALLTTITIIFRNAQIYSTS